MSNSSADPCHSDYYLALGQRVSFAVYFYMTPLYIIFSLFGHIVSLGMFFEKWKHGEGAYMFQIILSVSEAFYALSHTISSIAMRRVLSGYPGMSFPWFQSCYGCIFFSAHLAIATNNGFLTTTQLFSSCLAVDRFRALCRPMTYKPVSNRIYISCSVFCISVGFSTSIYQYFENTVTHDVDTGFFTVVRSVYFDSPPLAVLNYLRGGVRVLALLILSLCNIGIPYFYWKRYNASKHVLTSSIEQERRKNGKILTMLTISECTLMITYESFMLAFDIWLHNDPPCRTSRLTLYGSLLDGLVEVTTALKFYLMMILSKDFRKMFNESLKVCKCGVSSSVQPMIQSTLVNI